MGENRRSLPDFHDPDCTIKTRHNRTNSARKFKNSAERKTFLVIEGAYVAAETAELSVNFNRRRTVGNQHSNAAKGFQAPKQLLPTGDIKLRDPIRRKCSNDIDLRHTEVNGRVATSFFVGSS